LGGVLKTGSKTSSPQKKQGNTKNHMAYPIFDGVFFLLLDWISAIVVVVSWSVLLCFYCCCCGSASLTFQSDAAALPTSRRVAAHCAARGGASSHQPDAHFI